MLRKEIVQPLVLATLLAVGSVAICCLAALWVFEVYREEVVGAGEHLGFLPDGTPLVASHPDGPRGGPRFRDLQGNPLMPSEEDMNAQLRGCSLAAQPPQTTDPLGWDERVHSCADGRWPATYWYFLSDGRANGAGYFVGYDSKSKARVGYLGTAGFRTEPVLAEEQIPFSGPTGAIHSRLLVRPGYGSPVGYPGNRGRGRAPHGFVSEWDVYVFGRDGKLYHADLQERRMHVALENSRLRSAAFYANPKDTSRGLLFHLAARTEDAVLVLNAQGRMLARYPIPEALRNLDLTFSESNAGEAVLYWSSPEDELATEQAYRIFWVKPDGRFREAAVSLAQDSMLQPMRIFGGMTMPSPLGLGGSLVRARYKELLNKGLSASPAEALVRALTELWPALALAQMIAFLCAVLCYRRQVRYGVSRTERIIWPLFVLLLGLPGWIGYRFGRSWPVLEACPECGAAVPRDRESCRCCTNEFPRPALKGTEVFA